VFDADVGVADVQDVDRVDAGVESRREFERGLDRGVGGLAPVGGDHDLVVRVGATTRFGHPDAEHGTPARRTTCSVTLPITYRSTPVRPWVPHRDEVDLVVGRVVEDPSTGSPLRTAVWRPCDASTAFATGVDDVLGVRFEAVQELFSEATGVERAGGGGGGRRR